LVGGRIEHLGETRREQLRPLGCPARNFHAAARDRVRQREAAPIRRRGKIDSRRFFSMRR